MDKINYADQLLYNNIHVASAFAERRHAVSNLPWSILGGSRDERHDIGECFIWMPRLKAMVFHLLAANWFKRSASQLRYQRCRSDNRNLVCPMDHAPLKASAIHEIEGALFVPVPVIGSDRPSLIPIGARWRERFIIHQVDVTIPDLLLKPGGGELVTEDVGEMLSLIVGPNPTETIRKDAAAVSATITRDMVRPMLRWIHGPSHGDARFELRMPDDPKQQPWSLYSRPQEPEVDQPIVVRPT